MFSKVGIFHTFGRFSSSALGFIVLFQCAHYIHCMLNMFSILSIFSSSVLWCISARCSAAGGARAVVLSPRAPAVQDEGCNVLEPGAMLQVHTAARAPYVSQFTT